ncbi:MAG: PEGA domain-containing protein, partial [Myxococcota bacterium]
QVKLVVIDINAGDDTRTAIETRIDPILKDAGYQMIANAATVDPLADEIAGCQRKRKRRANRCTLSALQLAGANYFLQLAANPQQTKTAQVTGRLFTVSADGRALQSTDEERRCPDCESEALAGAAEEVIAALLGIQRTAPPPKTQLAIQVTPADATLTIDGRPVPDDTQIHEVTPGRHAVKATREGYKPAEMPVEVAEGETETVEIALEPVQVTTPENGNNKEVETPPSSRWGGLKWATMGLGVAVVTTGAALFVLDGQGAGLSDDREWTTADEGLTVGVVGAVLIGGAIIMLLTDEIPSSQPESGVSLRVTGDSFGFGYTGRF